MKNIMGSLSPIAHYNYNHNTFILKVPFIHPFNNIRFTKLEYNEHTNQIEIKGFIPNRDYNKLVYNNIPNDIVVLK